jgi:hypothetical protein
MRLRFARSFAVLTFGILAIASCTPRADVPCIGGGCTEEPHTRENGSFLFAIRQSVFDQATAPGGSCERACCEMPGGEFGVPGVWDESAAYCSFHVNHLQLSACENWCHKQIARTAPTEQEKLEQIERDVAAGPSDQGSRANGAIETREHMGAKALVLAGMVVPVVRSDTPSPVQALELTFTREPERTTVVVWISPKQAEGTDWKYLRCHSVGLSVPDDWYDGGAKGSDGSWLRFEATHDGSVHDSGGTFEIVAFSVELTTIREWALADGSGGQICLDQYTLSTEQRALIREFLDAPI